jgi:hypothetical protein
MTTDTTEEIAVLARLAALPAAWVTCELHDAAINSRSAVLIGLWSLSAQFRIRIAQNVADTRKEIPGKHPGLCAVLSRLPNLACRERRGASYLLCFGTVQQSADDAIRRLRLWSGPSGHVPPSDLVGLAPGSARARWQCEEPLIFKRRAVPDTY